MTRENNKKKKREKKKNNFFKNSQTTRESNICDQKTGDSRKMRNEKTRKVKTRIICEKHIFLCFSQKSTFAFGPFASGLSIMVSQISLSLVVCL